MLVINNCIIIIITIWLMKLLRVEAERTKEAELEHMRMISDEPLAGYLII